MFISISEFSEERNVDRDTVNAWIRNHPEVNEKCGRKGKDKVIDTDSEAYKLLEKQYPLPKPVEVIVDTKSREELVKAQQVIIHLQSQNAQLEKELAIADSKQFLLEEKDKQLEQMEKILDDTKNELNLNRQRADQIETELKNEVKELRERLEESQEQLQEEIRKPWYKKIFGK